MSDPSQPEIKASTVIRNIGQLVTIGHIRTKKAHLVFF